MQKVLNYIDVLPKKKLNLNEDNDHHVCCWRVSKEQLIIFEYTFLSIQFAAFSIIIDLRVAGEAFLLF